jgi:Predicted phosphatase/phosphohexomutase
VAIQGLLFDFDGLLVDTETPSRLVWEELYREHGHELPQDQWATLVGTIGAPFDPFDHLEELVGRRLDHQALTTRRRAASTSSRISRNYAPAWRTTSGKPSDSASAPRS